MSRPVYEIELERLQYYAELRSLSLTNRLGFGQDGIVFLTHVPSAVKALSGRDQYLKERDTYLRFEKHKVRRVGEFAIPELINFDDELLVVEMSVVTPPFVVDFAGVYLNEPPPYFYEVEVMSAWEDERRELFGDDWPIVVSLLSELRSYGVYLNDVKPGNVTIRHD